MNGIPVWLVAVGALGAPEGPSKAGELAAAVVAAQSGIERLLFDAVCTDREGRGPSTSDRYVEAFDARRHFSDVMHLASRAAPPWLDPKRRQVWVRPGGTVALDVFGRNVRLEGPGPARPLRTCPYPDVIGWRPPGAPRPSGGDGASLADVFAAGRVGSLSVAPERESVDGLACEVVTAGGGRDRLWVCPDRGYALVRRVVRRGDRADTETEYRARDFQQVGPGLWLPRVCEGEVRAAGGGPPERSFRIEVTHLGVNDDVPDSLLEPKFPPGAVVFTRDGRMEAMIPGGTDLLDLWVGVAVTLVPPSGLDLSPWTASAVPIIAGVLLLGLGWWLASHAPVRAGVPAVRVGGPVVGPSHDDPGPAPAPGPGWPADPAPGGGGAGDDPR